MPSSLANPPENSVPSAPTNRPITSPPAVFDSRSLFAGRRELVILHQGESYRLSQTRQGKLILTK